MDSLLAQDEKSSVRDRISFKRTVDPASVSDRFMIWAYRALGFGCLVAWTGNVYKHGWSLSSISWPILLSALLFSLGTNPARRRMAWLVRSIVALAALVFLLGVIVYSLFPN
jgi:hypothetical protein